MLAKGFNRKMQITQIRVNRLKDGFSGAVMKLSKIVALTIALFVMNAQAEPVVTVFGIPLGGKLNFPLEICSEKAVANKTICWTEKPLLQTGGNLTGSIKFYNTDNLPSWAAYAKFWVNIAAPGNDMASVGSIQELMVSDVSDGFETIKSIASKFGAPTETGSKKSPAADWKLKDISISVRCSSGCTVEFVSANLANARQRSMDSINRRDDNRPKAP